MNLDENQQKKGYKQFDFIIRSKVGSVSKNNIEEINNTSNNSNNNSRSNSRNYDQIY